MVDFRLLLVIPHMWRAGSKKCAETRVNCVTCDDLLGRQVNVSALNYCFAGFVNGEGSNRFL